MDSWLKDSWSLGSFAGAIVAAAAAAEMLAANELTINPLSSSVLVLVWALYGGLIGGAVAIVGGRFSMILRQPCSEGALALSILLTGHLLLPTGFGLAMAAAAVIGSRIRNRWYPHAVRLDVAVAAGLAVAAILIPQEHAALPPLRSVSEPLAVGSPLPGSLPVTITVHTQGTFPKVPAVHLPLRPLDSRAPGRRAALWTGRLPDRTRLGRDWPRSVPGGGGIHRTPPWPGSRWLVSRFPRVQEPAGTLFEPVGTLSAIAEASGIAVLRHAPHPDDPPHFLRILDAADAPDRELASAAGDPGAWIDVTLDRSGGSVALAGQGFVLAHTEGHMNLIDVAPTTLHLLGLSIPRSIDGRVLTELLLSPGPGSRAPRYGELWAYADGAEAADAPDADADANAKVSELTTSR